MIITTVIVLLLLHSNRVTSTTTSTSTNSTSCSLGRLAHIQEQFKTCSRGGEERQEEEKEEEEPCQEVEKVLVECGELWRPCLSAMEIRRVRGREIKNILRRAGRGNTDRYGNCTLLMEYR